MLLAAIADWHSIRISQRLTDMCCLLWQVTYFVLSSRVTSWNIGLIIKNNPFTAVGWARHMGGCLDRHPALRPTSCAGIWHIKNSVSNRKWFSFVKLVHTYMYVHAHCFNHYSPGKPRLASYPFGSQLEVWLQYPNATHSHMVIPIPDIRRVQQGSRFNCLRYLTLRYRRYLRTTTSRT